MNHLKQSIVVYHFYDSIIGHLWDNVKHICGHSFTQEFTCHELVNINVNLLNSQMNIWLHSGSLIGSS
jgi:hypothetical protein